MVIFKIFTILIQMLASLQSYNTSFSWTPVIIFLFYRFVIFPCQSIIIYPLPKPSVAMVTDLSKPWEIIWGKRANITQSSLIKWN